MQVQDYWYKSKVGYIIQPLQGGGGGVKTKITGKLKMFRSLIIRMTLQNLQTKQKIKSLPWQISLIWRRVLENDSSCSLTRSMYRYTCMWRLPGTGTHCVHATESHNSHRCYCCIFTPEFVSVLKIAHIWTSCKKYHSWCNFFSFFQICINKKVEVFWGLFVNWLLVPSYLVTVYMYMYVPYCGRNHSSIDDKSVDLIPSEIHLP